ncbi:MULTISPECIES: 4-hydroxy-tetrahydrodipicolinate synthase [Streptomyces]|uniref:4-hydroxy-tetrahydrodipicolinate synthase n=1 Tax=Streptomyces doudnae TaxID=3075536 RepID=A0ABD5F2X3_9ACTN|nr:MULTISPECIES: 4-hydroxy-tetrahydrodipicolinate synthase [unclassified Streptomyces]MDT0440274.1 4-hydroxy-tetrahydrodipicolinate synthase [Streptomyces sp. DSM 41981]MYQ62049.1 4-hydroxy-tetrahydrodipicolinate synthase [Streptomyces sp. SID4950]SCD29426.1 4-hydroxy-tetrahydrodipicolinate synthase [Streptomyces sp. SolWspMP-5a-2]
MSDVRSRLRGSIVPLVTPFHPDGEIDTQSLGELIEHHVTQGSHGISVTGTTGEPGALTLSERLHVLSSAAEALRGRLPFVPGTGTHQLPETITITRHAAELGADAALVIVPYYARPTQEGLYAWYSSLAEAVDIPILMYNIPSRTGVELAPETVGRLFRDVPNIIGMKEASPDFAHANFVLRETGPEFLLFSGLEALCFPLLAIGGAGFISVTANLVPREIARMYEAVREGAWDEARDLHFRLLDLNDVVLTETNPTAVKWLMWQQGAIGPTLRAPLAPLSRAGQARVRKAAESWNLLEETR